MDNNKTQYSPPQYSPQGYAQRGATPSARQSSAQSSVYGTRPTTGTKPMGGITQIRETQPMGGANTNAYKPSGLPTVRTSGASALPSNGYGGYSRPSGYNGGAVANSPTSFPRTRGSVSLPAQTPMQNMQPRANQNISARNASFGDKQINKLFLICVAIVAFIFVASSFLGGFLIANNSKSTNLATLNAPTLSNVESSDTKLVWTKTTGTSQYRVFINKDMIEVVKDDNSFDFQYAVKADKYKNEYALTLRVQAIATNTSVYRDSGYSNPIIYINPNPTIKKLNTPSNLAIDDNGRLSYTGDANANLYSIDINGSVKTTDQVFVNIADAIANPGTYTIGVIAKDSDGEYQDSEKAEITKNVSNPGATKLATPTGLAYNDTNNTFNWNSVTNANSYGIIITNTATNTTNEYQAATNNYQLNIANISNGSYSACVVAKSTDLNYSDSDRSASVSFTINKQTQLSTPNLSISGTMLTWQPIPNADSYKVQVDNNVEYSQGVTSYNLEYLTGASSYVLKVKAVGIGNYTDSEWATINYTPQPSNNQLSPPSLLIQDKTLSWTAIPNSSGYKVQVDSNAETSLTATTYDLTALASGHTYVLKVKAVGSGNYTDSEWSTKSYLAEDGVIDTSDTSPDAVEARIKELLPKDSFERLFPLRFGSPDWKKYNYWYYADKMDKIQEYYSYDNLIKAARLAASKKIKVEWIRGSNYTAQTRVIDKATGSDTLIAPGQDFNADWNIGKPVDFVEVDLGSFMNAKLKNDSKRDLAAFIANMAHETTGGNVGDGIHTELEGGLFFNEEVGYLGAEDAGVCGYVDEGNTVFPAQPGKSYHGRGPVQLSWNYNYGLISGILYGDKMVLLKNPSTVCDDGAIGFATGLLFWMTPQPPKASCSSVMTRTYELKPEDIARGYKNDFGLTIIIFNGGLEGNLTEDDHRIKDRAGQYRRMAKEWDIDITGEKLDTSGWGAWT